MSDGPRPDILMIKMLTHASARARSRAAKQPGMPVEHVLATCHDSALEPRRLLLSFAARLGKLALAAAPQKSVE